MTNFLILFLSLGAGWLARRSARFPPESARALNAFVIGISLPAVVWVQFPRLLATTRLSPELLWPVLAPWLVFLGAIALFLRRRRGPRARAVALALTAGLGNTSFVGFPLLEALLGGESLRYGVLCDQFGTFLALSFIGIPLAASAQGARVPPAPTVKRVLTFPPFLALLVAGAWWVAGQPGGAVLTPAAERIGATLVPLALFAVGLQIRFDREVLGRQKRALAAGLAYKLLAAPLLIWALGALVVDPRGLAARASLLEAGMAPMITAAVVVAEFGLDGELASLMVAVGIPLSLVSVPLLELLSRGI